MYVNVNKIEIHIKKSLPETLGFIILINKITNIIQVVQIIFFVYIVTHTVEFLDVTVFQSVYQWD